MTKVFSFIHGIYPRSEILAQTSRNAERKRQTVQELNKEFKKDFINLVSLQKKSDFNYIEDGKLTWHDIFRPISESTEGINPGALTRWYDNNSFYRQPVITGKIQISIEKLQTFFPKITPVKKWKVTLPSAFSFAKLSRDTTASSFEETLEKIIGILETIIIFLNKQGVSLIQLNETYIPYHKATKQETDLFIKSLKKLAQVKGNAKLAIHFYFGDAAAVISNIPKDLNIDIVGIDFYQTNLSALPKNISYDIIAGIVDGRNSLLENEKVLKTFISKVIKTLKPQILYLANNSDLELLPEPVAKKKIQLLGKLQNL